MLSKGDRVRLERGSRPEGTVNHDEKDGKAYVRLDGGSAASFATADLTPLGGTETKDWPPANIETK